MKRLLLLVAVLFALPISVSASNATKEYCSVHGTAGYAKISFTVTHWPWNRYISNGPKLEQHNPYHLGWMRATVRYGKQGSNKVYVTVKRGLTQRTAICKVSKGGWPWLHKSEHGV